MINFFKSLPKHLKTAVVSILRHIAMSFSASSAVTVTLVLFAVFLLIAGNVNRFTNNIAGDLQIHVQLSENIKESQELEEVKESIEKVDGVKQAILSTKDDELELMIREKGEEFAMYRGENNPLYHAFFVSVEDANQIAQITNQISKLPSVKAAVYGGSSVSKLIEVLNSVRTGGFVFVILLTVLAIFLISNSIKLTIYARNNEISIMRNVGAANWYIKVPFMMEGMIIGIIGSIIPCIVTVVGYAYLYKRMGGMIVTSMFSLLPVVPFTIYVCIALVTGGIVVGLVGSFFSTTKYLHWKR